MKAFDGFKSEKSSQGSFGQLPAGAYVGKITSVKIEGAEPDQTLAIAVDVTEGEHQGYFTQRLKHDQSLGGKFEVKYKGVYRLRIPNPANTRAMYPDSDKKRFNDAIWRIEASNPGYHWDWNEKGLVGRLVGFSMQEDEYNGNAFTRIGRFEVVDDVRAGIIPKMKPRKPRQDASASAPAEPSGFTQVETELPF
jgi:hypothetical protein